MKSRTGNLKLSDNNIKKTSKVSFNDKIETNTDSSEFKKKSSFLNKSHKKNSKNEIKRNVSLNKKKKVVIYQ